MSTPYVTATDIYKFFHCPHWPYYDRYATDEEKLYRRKQTEGEKNRQEDGVAHEAEIVRRILKDQELMTAPRVFDPVQACVETLKLMRSGAPWIYQGTLTDGNWTGRPDLLERHEGESALGSWYYLPVDVKTSTRLQKYQKMQLMLYASLLKRIQGRFPAEAAIINIEGVRLPFETSESLGEFEIVMDELDHIVGGEKPDLVLRKSCYDTGVWGKLCEQYSEASNDISLLYKVDVQKLKALRSLGIRTVDDAALIDPSALAGQAKGLTFHALDSIVRQAKSLQSKLVIIRKPMELTTHGLEIHFDIESDPPNDKDYLYGFLIRGLGRDEYKAFVAESLAHEEGMWRSFLAWLETLPLEYTVYHFSPYEMTRLAVMESRYGGSHWLDLFRASMVDLREEITACVTFPLYFYGLKYIAKFLGFYWRGELVKSGGESVDQFERYLESGDRAILDAIILYNEDDVRATAFLKDWLQTYGREGVSYAEPYPWKLGKNPFTS